ncbi:MAG: GntR family transcriptional regulator [Chloroflexota bacterium]
MTDTSQTSPPVASQYRTMEKIVADYLRSAILAGRLGPGDRINQDDVARELGVSRMPVRDALRIVQSEGLVEIHPHRAAIVVSLRPKDIAEIFEIRAILEGRAAELAAPYLTDSTIGDLRAVWEEMDRTLKNWDHNHWLGLNRRFHTTIYGASGWTRLCGLIDTQLNTLFPYQRAASGIVARRYTAHEQHCQILLAAETRDAVLLGQRTAEHLRSTARDLIGFVATHRGEETADPAAAMPSAMPATNRGAHD